MYLEVNKVHEYPNCTDFHLHETKGSLNISITEKFSGTEAQANEKAEFIM